MLRNLLLYRFIIFNALVLFAGGIAYEQRLVHYVYEHDSTYISVVITALFALSWLFLAKWVLRTSRLLNLLKKGHGLGWQLSQTKTTGDLKRLRQTLPAKYRAKIAWLHDASGWMVNLGLIGTVIGFTLSLNGIDQDALGSAAGVQSSIGDLLAGMRIALNTTIAGAILGMWNEVNFRMLRTAQELMLLDLFGADT